jgi:hypothetical protein
MATPYFVVTGSITGTSGEDETAITKTSTSYGDSTAVSATEATTVTYILDDCDTTSQAPGGGSCPVLQPHLPLPHQPAASIYLDRIFGSFMFQDAEATPLTASQRDSLLAALTPTQVMDIAINSAQSVQTFPDVPHVMQGSGAINFLATAGIIRGFPDGTFRPQSPLTRGQLALALARYRHLNSAGSGATFTDVPPQSVYVGAVQAVVSAGLMAPTSASQFAPDSPVSREVMATSLSNAFGLLKQPNAAAGGTAAVVKVSDEGAIASTALPSVRAVVGAKYMSLFSDDTFKPAASVTRAEAAEALLAALKDQVK